MKIIELSPEKLGAAMFKLKTSEQEFVNRYSQPKRRRLSRKIIDPIPVSAQNPSYETNQIW